MAKVTRVFVVEYGDCGIDPRLVATMLRSRFELVGGPAVIVVREIVSLDHYSSGPLCYNDTREPTDGYYFDNLRNEDD